ncbi:MAG: hypothetical protein ACOCX1_05480 [Fimbriimonadaceae bacterium]
MSVKDLVASTPFRVVMTAAIFALSAVLYRSIGESLLVQYPLLRYEVAHLTCFGAMGAVLGLSRTHRPLKVIIIAALTVAALVVISLVSANAGPRSVNGLSYVLLVLENSLIALLGLVLSLGFKLFSIKRSETPTLSP